MLLVGLTGGIGSGKSTAAARFAEHGVPVISADDVAREIVAPGKPALADIVAHFGPDVLTAAGTLDRPALARKVFADAEARQALDRITHPRIAAVVAERIADMAASNDPPPLVVVDHPLLLETGQAARFDVVVVVDTPADVRVERLVEARGMDEDDVRARMRVQADDEIRRAAATHVIDNHGDRDELIAQVDAVYLDLVERAAGRPA